MHNIHFHPETSSEVNEAIEWYESKVPNLGIRFYNELMSSIESIQENPHIWPKSLHNMNRYLLKHFPFGIFYEYNENEIQINAIANLNRKPDYWAGRVSGT